MPNFENVRYPALPSKILHKARQSSRFYKNDNPPKSMNVRTTRVDAIGLIVLEECVGYKGRWHKVKLHTSDEIGYIPTDSVELINGTKPSITSNLLDIYLPDISHQINWRDEKTNVLITNNSRGMYSVSYDTGIEKLNEDLSSIMERTLYSGLSFILKELGMRSDEEYVKEIQNKYYLFGAAEEIHASFRGCSIIKVLVSLPMRYAHSEELQTAEEYEKESDDFTENDGEDNEQQENKEYIKISFNNKAEFDEFFNNIEAALSAGSIIYKSRKWIVDPVTTQINLDKPLQDIKDFRKELQKLIFKNITLKNIDHTTNAPSLLTQVNLSFPELSLNSNKIIRNLYDYILFIQPLIDKTDVSWEGQLTIVLDAEEKTIVNVSFKDTNQKKVRLISNYLSFLNNEIIKSKQLSKLIFNKYLIDVKKIIFNTLSWEAPFLDAPQENNKKIIINNFKNKKLEELNASPKYENLLKSSNFGDFNQWYSSFTFQDKIEDIDNFETLINAQAVVNSLGLSLLGSLFNAPQASLKSPDQALSEWVTGNHYPEVTSLSAEPLDVFQCVGESIDDVGAIWQNGVQDIKSLQDTLKHYENIEYDKRNQTAWEGSEWSNLIKNFTSHTFTDDLAIVFGQKETPGKEWFNKINSYMESVRRTNIAGYLIEGLRCAFQKLDPQTLSNILQNYNNAKKMIEDILFATLCNPFVGAGLQTIKGIRLPRIPTYDPKKSLRKELEKFFVKFVQDVIALTMREMLKQIIKFCLADPNKEQNAGNSQDTAPTLLGALANPENNVAVEDLLSDLFKDYSEADEESKQALKDKVSNLLESIFCLLTTSEMCKILQGNEIELEAYVEIIRVISAKIPELKTKISTIQDVKNLFAKMGNIIGKDNLTSICPDVQIPAAELKCGCDKRILRQARETILSNKNLPPEAINDIIDSIQNEERKNIEDVLKFLESNEPVDISKYPTVLCDTDQNGDPVPPAIDLTPSTDSFKRTLQNMLEDIYEKFEQESEACLRGMYSVSSSKPSLLTFISESGQIITSNPPQTSNNSSDNTKKILPFYIFSETLKNPIQLNENNEYNIFIDGNKQQKIDLNLIEEELISEVNDAQESFKVLLSNLVYDSLWVYATFLRRTVESDSWNLQNFASSPILKNLMTLDNYARRREFNNRPEENIDAAFDEIIKQYPAVNVAYLESLGASVYLYLAKLFFDGNGKRDFDTVVDMIAKSTLPKEMFPNLPGPSVEQEFKDRYNKLYKDAADLYGKVKDYFKVVFNTTIKFPSYNIIYNENDSLKLTTDKQYELYNINILQNTSSILKTENINFIDDQLSAYIKNSLNFTNSFLDKQQIYNSYYQKLNNSQIPPENQYRELYDDFFNMVLQTVNKKSIFMKTYKSTTGTTAVVDSKEQKIEDSYLPLTSLVQLKSLQTYKQKNCNIRPNYLDIDEVMIEAATARENTFCAQQKISEAIENNLPVNSSDLAKQETSETQNISLSAIHKLSLRTYIDEIVLRGLAVFGCYDSQIIRNDPLFLDYVSLTVESEIRMVDETYFQILMEHIVKMYKINNYDQEFVEGAENLILDTSKQGLKNRRQIFKKVVENELRVHALPKLTKRLVEDTNNQIISQTNKFNEDSSELNEVNIRSYYDNFESLVEFINQKLFTKDSKSELPISFFKGDYKYYIKKNTLNSLQQQELGLIPTAPRIDYASEQDIYLLNINSSSDQDIEFRLLFEFLFPIKRFIALAYIINAQSNLTKIENKNVFSGTKSSLRESAKIIISNGQPITPDPNNPQDQDNSDPLKTLFSFILDSLISTPISIVKGFIEGSDPNVALSSGIYKIVKGISQETPSYTIPAIGVPLMSWVGSPFMINPLNIIYYTTGLWYEAPEKNKDETLSELLTSGDMSNPLCEDKKPEVKLDDDSYYIIKNKITKDTSAEAKKIDLSFVDPNFINEDNNQNRRLNALKMIYTKLKLNNLLLKDNKFDYVKAATLILENKLEPKYFRWSIINYEVQNKLVNKGKYENIEWDKIYFNDKQNRYDIIKELEIKNVLQYANAFNNQPINYMYPPTLTEQEKTIINNLLGVEQ